MTRSHVLSALVLATLTVGCHASTQGKFLIPPHSQLVVNGTPVALRSDGSATMSAFGWGGAHYELTRDGKTLRSGSLDTTFRPISILWPPFGVLYVPKGLEENRMYDLTTMSKVEAKN